MLRVVLVVAVVGVAARAAAQSPLDAFRVPPGTPVALVADAVLFDERAGTVTARGSVEVYYGLRTLTASEIVYDSRADRVTAAGPVTLRTEEGSVIVADFAELDAGLREGVATGARALIADGAGRMAAVEARRIDGRYTSLSKAVYSSCDVCPEAPTPLWAIRARRVTHDDVEKVVHYEDAVFEVMGRPVGWLPYFSHPDPSVRRRSGFLAPTFSNATTYGLGAQTPYFLAIDPSRDATLTPFLTTEDGPILIGEYRQRCDAGALTLSGSAGWLDTASDGGMGGRGAFAGTGRFDASALGGETIGFGSGTRVGFDAAAASDRGYLRRYDLSEADRLENRAFVENWGARDFTTLSGYYVQTLREGERQGEIPVALPDFAFRRSVASEEIGVLSFEGAGLYLARSEGRDVGRLSVLADWERTAVLDVGVAVRGFGVARADFYHVADDPTRSDDTAERLIPLGGVEARYPLISRGVGATHLVEPIVQFVAAPNGSNPDDIPNEDSLIVEFDETNLFDIDRFPGRDRVESGVRLNYGLRYERIADDSLRLDASFGQVLRLSEESAFSGGSGLGEQSSDFVSAVSVGLAPWFAVSSRLRVSENLDVNRNEARGEIDLGGLRLEGAYVYLRDDATAGALDDRAELALAGEVDVARGWTFGAAMRRDLEEDQYVRAGVRLAYVNECSEIALGVGRDFTDTADSPAATTVSLRLRLFGLAEGGGRRAGACARR